MPGRAHARVDRRSGPGSGQGIRVMRQIGHPGHAANMASGSCSGQGIWVMRRTGPLGQWWTRLCYHAVGRASGVVADGTLSLTEMV